MARPATRQRTLNVFAELRSASWVKMTSRARSAAGSKHATNCAGKVQPLLLVMGRRITSHTSMLPAASTIAPSRRSLVLGRPLPRMSARKLTAKGTYPER